MGFDFSFVCTKCNKASKPAIRANTSCTPFFVYEVIDSFRFLMKHINECADFDNGELYIKICETLREKEDTSERLLDFFPYSNDWEPEVYKKEMDLHEKRQKAALARIRKG